MGSIKGKRKREAAPELLEAAEMIVRLAKLGIRTDEKLKKLDLGRFVAEHIDELSKEQLKLAVRFHQSARQGRLWELLTESVPLPEPEAEPEPAAKEDIQGEKLETGSEPELEQDDGFRF